MSIFDMGETSSCTPHKSEYFGIKMEINTRKLKRIDEVLKIEGIGMVEYKKFHNREDKITLILQDFYVPQFSSDLRIIYKRDKNSERGKENF